MAEAQLLAQALSLSSAIRQSSKQSLRPYRAHIQQLSVAYHQLDNDLRETQDQGLATTWQENLHLETEGQATASVLLGRSRGNVLQELLERVVDSIPCVTQAVWNFSQPCQDPRACCSRELHLQNVLTLQRRRLALSEDTSERITVLCACLSLAQDFRNFEIRGGWTPKQDQLIERILDGQDVACHRVSKNIKYASL